VHPFPEEDELEAGNCHSSRACDLLILRRLLIEIESVLPVGLRERRDRSAERFPFGDREATFGEPRDPADHDHGENEGGDEQEEIGERTRVLGVVGAVRACDVDSAHETKRLFACAGLQSKPEIEWM
jgi:hypothetical protein